MRTINPSFSGRVPGSTTPGPVSPPGAAPLPGRRRFATLRTLLALLLPLWAGPGTAQPSTALQAYEARVPVADQSPAVRESALQQGLRTVVVRVSGENAVYEAQSLIAQAPQLVQRYGYEREVDGSLVLVAGFDSRAVDSRLKSLGLPVWGVYAAAVEEVQMRISGIRSAAGYAEVMATLRGLPGVRSIRPIRASVDTLDLRVQAEGGAGRLSGALLAAQTLVRDPDGPAELSYRLAGSAQP